MNQSNKSIVTALMMTGAVLVNSTMCIAGGSESHGGAAIVCKMGATITSIDLVDLYNGAIYNHLTFGNPYVDEAAVIQKARTRLLEAGAVNFLSSFDDQLALLNTAWTPLPKGAKPFPANDAALAIIPPDGCLPIYIVDYTNWNGVAKALVYTDIVSDASFTPVQAGALKVHESVYASARKYWNDVTSERSQEITSLLVADSLTSAQVTRLKNLTLKVLSIEIPQLLGVKITALKTFKLWSRTENGKHHNVTHFDTMIQNGEVVEVNRENIPQGVWHYSGSPVEIAAGEEFIVNSVVGTNLIEIHRLSNNTRLLLFMEKTPLPGIADLNDGALLKAAYPL